MDKNNYNRDICSLINEIEETRGKNPEIVIEASNKLETIGRNINDDSLIGYAYFSRGETYYLLNDANNFYSNMLSSLGPLEHSKEWKNLVFANNMLGIVSLNRGNAPFALDYFIKAISICQDNNLTEIEWIIHMNLGSLYLNIEEYRKSLNHTNDCITYLKKHDSIDNYVESLTTVYLGMARAYIKLNNINKVIETVNLIKKECMPYLDEVDKIVIYCFFARMHDFLEEEEARDYWIELVKNKASNRMPILDVFDDFYDYLEMLLNIKKYEDFFIIYGVMDDLTKRTTIKNLEKKLLTLKIRYFRSTGQWDEYKFSAALYFELSEYMERENRKMVSNMLVMKNSYMELTKINKRVEQENNFLQKRSMTDPLTGMYNRFRLNEYSEEVFEKALKGKESIAVEILDIDCFKQYNDNYGHQAGDNCIKFIASILLSIAEEEGIFAARYGGDEFVMIYKGFTKDEISEKIENLRKRVMEANFEHRFSLVDSRVTITQGVCFGNPKAGESVFKYLNLADKMLYKVKQKSRNDYLICDYSDN